MNWSNYFPASGQSFQFDYFSILLLVFILINAFTYGKKGFVYALISLIASMLSFALAGFFCKQVGSLLYNTGLGEKVYGAVYNWTSTVKDGALNAEISTATQSTVLPAAYEALGIPSVCQGLLTTLITSLGLIPETGAQISIVLAEAIANYAFIALGFVAILLLVELACWIMRIVLRKIIKVLKIGWLDHLLGVIIGIILAFVSYAFVAYVLMFFIPMNNGISTFIQTNIGYGDDSLYTITKAFLYFYNDILTLFASFGF